MFRLEVEANHVEVAPTATNFIASDAFDQAPVIRDEWIESTPADRPSQNGMRRTPRKSLIVVLPDNHVVSPDVVTERLRAEGDSEAVDVILACAGHPHSLATLQRRVRDLQVLFAPAGTSNEDLRELAMNRAPGDIVSLLTGTRVQV